ncbi:MAG: hypothetical protein KDC53_06335 [Saprospiraceae bacterium]|nr:hypothetical protein [Saprospiraceae bacterium]
MKKLIYSLFVVSFVFVFSNGVTAQNYNNAVGLRLAWGFGGTYKHFFNEKIAAEGIVNFRSWGTFGFRYRRTRITGLVTTHQPLEDVVEGLQWYVGGGAFAGFWSGAYSRVYDYSSTQIGIAGVVGLDYKFTDLPINVSLDWMPGIALVGGGGFTGTSGGLAIRYTF